MSFLLIHMGLLKVREPQERMTFLSCLRLSLFKDSSVRKTKFSAITAFLFNQPRSQGLSFPFPTFPAPGEGKKTDPGNDIAAEPTN